jgi:2-oxoglutarate ferredoxin oxidoreductase subunit gamma
MKKEVRFSGYGGQGIILMGNITAKAAVLYDSKNAVYTPSYGPEARGGAASSNVIISDGEIDYPYVTDIDVLVAMSQLGYENNISSLKKKGILVIDRDLVKLKEKGSGVAEIEATRIAEDLGKRIVANIVINCFNTH